MKEMLLEMGRNMGMAPVADVMHECGTHLIGDHKTTEGYMWYFIHDEYFSITKCDFVFLHDCILHMPGDMLYISLRLDQSSHLPPGKIVSFMEELGKSMRAKMPKGTRVSYTEVMYRPVFYKKHLDLSFSKLRVSLTDILKQMGGEHNWPPEMMKIITDITKCKLTGTAAELFFVGKAYELMSAILEMGKNRILKNESDYKMITEVIEYLNAHLDQNVRQKDLVKLSSSSPTKLKALFKRFTGQSITDYTADLRADKAAHLLTETDKNIVEISQLLGYETPTGFATAFKKQMGISPSEYRRQMTFHCLKNPSGLGTLSFQNLI